MWSKTDVLYITASAFKYSLHNFRVMTLRQNNNNFLG